MFDITKVYFSNSPNNINRCDRAVVELYKSNVNPEGFTYKLHKF